MIFTLVRGLLLLIAGFFPVFRVGVESLGFGSWVLIAFWVSCVVLFLVAVIRKHDDFRETINNSILSFASLIAAMVLFVEATMFQSNQLFQLTLAIWAFITGATEFWLGITKKIGSKTFVGSLGMLLGMAVVLVPADYYLEFVPEKAPPGWLDAPTMHIGLFGAYAVTAGVYLMITALSTKYGSSKENE